MIAAAVEDSNDPSKPTCACWVGARSNCFAVGYDDGSILVWGIPASTLKCRFCYSVYGIVVVVYHMVG